VKRDEYWRNINERFYAKKFELEAKKLLRNIDQSYSKAPHYVSIRELLTEVLGNSERNVSRFNISSIRSICQYLGIDTEIIISSELTFDKTLTAENRVIAINKMLGSIHYINPIGGIDLYSKERFQEDGLELSFLRPKLIPYQQSSTEFIPWLSIIDVLMLNSKDKLIEILNSYELI